jgi:uncharacterized protein (TIGR00369 family)
VTPRSDLQALVEAVTFAPGYTRSVGTKVHSVEAGSVTLTLDRTPELLQANGYFHGGVIAGLADHAAGGAVTTALPPGKFAVTICLQINFMSAANGQSLLARAKAVRVGSTIGVAHVDVTSLRDGAERLCATATVTLRVVELPAKLAPDRAAGAP